MSKINYPFSFREKVHKLTKKMATQHLKLPIEGGKFYHIYKSASIGDHIFFTPGNYAFFLRKMDLIIGDMVDLMAFCLLPNHFHLFFRAREVITIKEEYVDHPVEIGHFIGEGLRKLFAVYSANLTKQEGIADPLLDNNFSRIFIPNDDIARQMIVYIHQNSQFHNVTDNFTNYSHSSYPLMMGKHKTLIDKDSIMTLFADMQTFIDLHQQPTDWGSLHEYLIES